MWHLLVRVHVACLDTGAPKGEQIRHIHAMAAREKKKRKIKAVCACPRRQLFSMYARYE